MTLEQEDTTGPLVSIHWDMTLSMIIVTDCLALHKP